VVLEVELAHPDGRVVDLRLGLGEERPRPFHGEPGDAVDVGQSPGRLEHLAGGTAPTVSPTEEVERARGPIVVLEVLDPEAELADAHVAAVGVGRREVGEDPGSVDALPQEAVVGQDVVLVPGELLGQEPADAALLHDLGQGGRIAEHVGQPHVVGLDPELVEVEALAVDDLADQGLARGDVAVGLDPHAPGGLEASLGDPAFIRSHRSG
jgi:hypothetical protein